MQDATYLTKRTDFDKDSKDKVALTKTFKFDIVERHKESDINVLLKGEEVPREGILIGYMSYFDNADAMGDIVRRGAFTKTLKERTPKVLFSHDMARPIGKMLHSVEDKNGLLAVLQLNLDTIDGRETFEHFKFGSMDSFSIGFIMEKFTIIEDENTNNMFPSFEILEVKLLEVSAVSIPANDMALIQEVKTADEATNEEISAAIKITTAEAFEKELDIINTLPNEEYYLDQINALLDDKEQKDEDDVNRVLKMLDEPKDSTDIDELHSLLTEAAVDIQSETDEPEDHSWDDILNVIDKGDK